MKAMRFRSILILGFTIAQMVGATAMSNAGQPRGDQNDSQRIAPILSLVKAGGVSIWIEYHGACAEGSTQDIPLELRITPGERNVNANALNAIRNILRENDNLSIDSSTPGIIKVSTGGGLSPIPNLKLDDLKLDSKDRYNPNYAIAAAIGVSQASLQDLQATPLIEFGGLLGEVPSKGRPHLRQTSKYGTLNELLLDVSRTFKGVLVYKECKLENGTRLFDIYFYRL